MEPFLADYVERLEMLHGELKQALAAAPEAAIDWTPEPDVNSLAVLAAHVAGSERFWAAEMAGELGSQRVRAAEFTTAGVEAGALVERLDETLAVVRAVAAGLTAADMGRLVTLPDGAQRTVGYCLLHALEHTALHVGHAQLMVQLWQRQAADS
jgi:uncharacterized damage-inducible protein DinB